VGEVLAAPNFAGTEVLGGASGLDRVVSSVNVMENPDILPWVKPNELLITVGYSLQDRGKDMAGFFEELKEKELAAFGLKLGQYVTSLEPEAIAAADRIGFPILALPAAVSFDDLIADVYRARDSMLLGGLHRRSDREQELMGVALAGGGPEQVAQRLAELVECEVLVLGVGNEVVAHFRRDGRGQDPIDRGRLDNAMSAPIVFGSTYVGQLYVFPEDGPSSRFYPGLIPTSAQIMALAASREIAVASVDRRFRAEFVEQMLLNRVDETEVVRRCQALEWSIAFPAAIVHLSTDTLDAAAHLERIRDMLGWSLRAQGIDAPHAIVGGAVVAIVGGGEVDNPADLAARAVSDVLARTAKGTWSAGVSGPLTGWSDLPRGWEQAKVANRVIQTTKGVGATGRFDLLGVYRLLSEIDRQSLRGFAREALGELYEPTGMKEELRRTLKVLLETNLNVARTARELHYHYNSVRYRISQLEQILGPFMSDAARRLELHVALLICDMVD
jgi:purine catabolism regulator